MSSTDPRTWQWQTTVLLYRLMTVKSSPTFFLTTCLRQPGVHNVCAATTCSKLASSGETDKNKTNYNPLITGSTAELYIHPMLTCVGDIDIMFHFSSMLAIPAHCPAPTHLPAKFQSDVNVYKITDSEFPGYVFLQLRYLLTECTDYSKYQAKRVTGHKFILKYTVKNFNVRPIPAMIHGPAHTFNSRANVFSVDHVLCVRCLLWPTQAADWPRRDRNYTVGQIQQLLIGWSATDVMWFVWHIVCVNIMTGWVSISVDCHSHERKLYC